MTDSKFDIQNMTRAEVAQMLDVSERSITDFAALKNDPIPRKKTGHKVRYDAHLVCMWWFRRKDREHGINASNAYVGHTLDEIQMYLNVWHTGHMIHLPNGEPLLEPYNPEEGD